MVRTMRTLKYLVSVLGVAAALSVFSSAFAAGGSILGDTLNFERLYPDTATPYGDPVPYGAGSSVVTTVVTAGTSDVKSWFEFGRQLVLWDPEANTITFDFRGSTWCGINILVGCNPAGSGIFDGFRLTDSTNAFTSVSYTSTGPMLFQVSLVAGQILVNVDGDGTGVGTDLTLTVNSVPEPETYAMLVAGLGLLGLTARRRKQKAA